MNDSSYSINNQIIKASEKDYLATIVKVEGSAYRKEGTMMLFCENGQRYGVLSVGCLEEDIANRIQQLKKPSSMLLSFDMKSEDDLSWGAGAGCNGIIHVLVESCSESIRKTAMIIQTYLRNGEEITLYKKIEKNRSFSTVILKKNQMTVYQNGKDFIQTDDIKQDKGTAGLVSLSKKDYLYFQSFLPKRNVFIFGAGDDVKPLVSYLEPLNFQIVICDWREGYISNERFPQTCEKKLISTDKILQQIEVKDDDFVILMTHQFQKDQILLKQLLKQNISYIGILGSKSRTERLLEEKQIPANVYSPIGEHIHAEGPNEIAISIVAQLIRMKQIKVQEVGS
ncbi:XdhC family protein [Alkalihalobacillus trypoxylicola]|uniref:Xanthine dehydrogenase n=1 Tax=Alkalihalobacillus trypoxylicola TaxID=519424 RepID=A0A162F5I1_9BACI|nr:XdhC/CoxI family protein [Alkalihalobacillus trypoxylicola]KYG34834.1 hypothetical protein AZF04_00420 [Alkalihalobacillus trypoxylicola]